jgi:hypothetical protein
VAGCCKYGDDPSGSCAMESVSQCVTLQVKYSAMSNAKVAAIIEFHTPKLLNEGNISSS